VSNELVSEHPITDKIIAGIRILIYLFI
jgi:hypothetical protein